MFGARHIDQSVLQAYTVAMEALTLVKSHVDQCNRRAEDTLRKEIEMAHKQQAEMAAVTQSLEQVYSRISQLGNRFVWLFLSCAGAVILLLLSVLAYLLAHGLPYRVVN